MKDTLKKFLNIALTVVVLCMVFIGFSGCEVSYKIFETEYFKCRIKSGKIELYDLTELGKEQEIIVVPEKVKGKTVDILGTTIHYMDGSSSYSAWQSDNLKKIFMPNIAAPLDLKKFPNIQGVFRIFEPYINGGLGNEDNGYFPCYIPYDMYNSIKHIKVSPANVGYFYNHEDSPNKGYYWIDNYAYGERITFQPSAPARKGHKFSGWYKEAECINVWDFNVDKLHLTILNHEEQEIYQETKLYAKWVKK